MQHDLVIVRDCRGKPLRRVALGKTGETIYVSSERALAAVESGEMPAIGCPDIDVFEFDPAIFDRMEKEWNANNRVSLEMWNGLARFRPH